MKTKILNIQINASPSHNFRTTKGGKRILTAEPSFELTVVLTVERVREMKTGDIVRADDGMLYLCANIDENKATLTTVFKDYISLLKINQNVEIELERRYSAYVEGSSAPNHVKST